MTAAKPWTLAGRSPQLFGLGESTTAGLGGGVQVAKRTKVGAERGEIGRLRAEALEAQVIEQPSCAMA